MSDPDINSPSWVEPLVSVLVPAFNHQEYIECCRDRIAESSYAPLEILVLDHGSGDDTYVRACEWMENNAHRVMRVAVGQQTNQGVPRTLNALIPRAKDEYVALPGSDDAIDPEGIALRITFALLVALLLLGGTTHLGVETVPSVGLLFGVAPTSAVTVASFLAMRRWRAIERRSGNEVGSFV